MGLGEAGETVGCAGSLGCSNCREAEKNEREEPYTMPHAPCPVPHLNVRLSVVKDSRR